MVKVRVIFKYIHYNYFMHEVCNKYNYLNNFTRYSKKAIVNSKQYSGVATKNSLGGPRENQNLL